MEPRVVVVDLFDILSHAPVIQILNKRLSTRDILSLTQVCRWNYYTWALMSCYEVGFDLAQRIYKRYRWRYNITKSVHCSLWLRKRVAKCVIPKEEPPPGDPVWCIGGCGQKIKCPWKLDLEGAWKEGLIHNLCGGCFGDFFEKNKHWMSKIEFENEMCMFQLARGCRNAMMDFRCREGIELIFMGMTILPRVKAQECIKYWENEYNCMGNVKYARPASEITIRYGNHNL